MEALLVPRKLWAIPHGTTVDAGLLHHRADAGSRRIFLAVILAQDSIHGTVPAAVVVAHAIVLGESGNERAEGYRLIVVETRTCGVLIEEEHVFRIFLTGIQEVLVALQLADGVQAMTPDVAAERHGEQSAVLVRHLHQLGKQRPAVGLRGRRLVASLIEAPELLGIVPAKEIGEFLEEILKGHHVVVLNMRMSARCRLAGEPHAVLLAHRAPRLIGLEGVLRHLVNVQILVILAGE